MYTGYIIHVYVPLYRKLEPKLTPADQFDVIKVSTDSVFPLPTPQTGSGSGKKKELIVSYVYYYY